LRFVELFCLGVKVFGDVFWATEEVGIEGKLVVEAADIFSADNELPQEVQNAASGFWAPHEVQNWFTVFLPFAACSELLWIS
jgi:hypothetical protein